MTLLASGTRDDGKQANATGIPLHPNSGVRVSEAPFQNNITRNNPYDMDRGHIPY